MTSPGFRAAHPDDAEKAALLHADSWRRHYRGAYADSFLDSDVVADRRSAWSSRLAAPANSMTAIAEDNTGLVGPNPDPGLGISGRRPPYPEVCAAAGYG
ncbi:hypothetical protein ABIA33_007611 [Streptacidiphilus sp. MAP12-16]|uniref:hypothetical protein n=1 Tax=Streptacidiphilus sp. MAP12-16 TaxID=3156300 RepID=UPI0035115077